MKIAFYKHSGDWLDKMIRFCTRGPYSHCELVFSDGMCFSSSSRDKGVRFKKIELNPERWDVVEVPLSEGQESRIRNWCGRHDGLPYDYLGAVGVVFPLLKQWRKCWYCSEICGAGLRRLQPDKFVSIQMSPSSFWNFIKAQILGEA